MWCSIPYHSSSLCVSILLAQLFARAPGKAVGEDITTESPATQGEHQMEFLAVGFVLTSRAIWEVNIVDTKYVSYSTF